MTKRKHIIPAAILSCAALFTTSAIAGTYAEDQQVLSCADDAIGSIDVPDATESIHHNFSEIRKRVSGENSLNQFAGLTATILEDMTVGGVVEYDYRVTFRASVYDTPNQDTFSAYVKAHFNLDALGDVKYEMGDGFGWKDNFDRHEDLAQMVNAADMMAMEFATCMGLRFNEKEDGSIGQPVKYFPQATFQLARN
jgi:hypothetical protein